MNPRINIFLHLILFGLLVAVVVLLQPMGEQGALTRTSTIPGSPGRLVIVVVDSLPREARTDVWLMSALQPLGKRLDARWLDVRTCSANFTLPCVQTLLEGRESPFAAGLHNFTGRAGAEASLPGLAAVHGKRVLLISDHTLGSLYGRYASRSLDVQDWPLDHGTRDVRAIQEAKASLVAGEADLVLLHFVGTDHISHVRRNQPAAFRRHFQLVGEQLAELAGVLDFSRDHLLITGDHGHDKDGHHTRQSTALFIGPRFMEIVRARSFAPREIQQRDLLYWVAYPLGFPLPPGYEGDFPSLIPGKTSPLLQAFESQQRRELLRQGFAGQTLAEQAAQVKMHQRRQQTQGVLAYLPALLCYLGLLLGWMVERRLTRRLVMLVGFGLLAGVTSWVIPYPSLAIMLVGVLLIVGMVVAPRRGQVLVWLLVAGLAAVLAYHAGAWITLFHARSGFRSTALLFYAQLFLIGAILFWIGSKMGAGRRASTSIDHTVDLSPAEGVLVYCLFCLPSGVYYYQSGTNMLQGFIGASLVWALWDAVRARQLPWSGDTRLPLLPLALAAIALPFLFLQDAGGWEWRPYLSGYLDDVLGPVLTLLVYYLVGLGVTWLLPGWKARGILLTCWIAAHGYSVGFGQHPLSWYVGSLTPVVFLIGWVELGQRSAPLPVRRLALICCATLCTTVWFSHHGFSLARVDFVFALPLMAGVQSEWNVFVLVFFLSLLKYGFPVILALIYLRLREGAARFDELTEGIFLYLQLKLATLLLQILVGEVGAGEDKLYELAIADLAFIGGLFILLGLVFGAMTLVTVLAGVGGAGKAGRIERTPPRST